MKAILTIGISASGKTTWAGMQKDFEVISRDDIRFGILFPGIRGWKDYKFTNENESRVTYIQKGAIERAARDGLNIIIADTNINTKNRKHMVRELKLLGYEVEYLVIHVSIENAIQRDSYRRYESVGENIIKQQFEKFNAVIESIRKEKDSLGVGLLEIFN